MEKIELKEQSFLLEGAYALLNLYTETASGEYCFTRSLRGFSHMIRHYRSGPSREYLGETFKEWFVSTLD